MPLFSASALNCQEKNKKKTGELARQLIKQTKSEITSAVLQEKVFEFIQTIVIDKFANLSREELEAMWVLYSKRLRIKFL